MQQPELAQALMAPHAATWQRLAELGGAALLEPVAAATLTAWQRKHGDFQRWLAALEALPSAAMLAEPMAELERDCRNHLLESVEVTSGLRLSESRLKTLLMPFHPWRKGPFTIDGHLLDTEWRSDWKWQRVVSHLDWQDQHVLDVGCGNGYYGWRMLGAGAASVTGIDPTPLFVMQFRAIKHWLQQSNKAELPIDVLPIAVEALPAQPACFDIVCSMGVLYHRRSPMDHLLQLRECLRPGGRLLLETLVVDGQEAVLVPAGGKDHRYAQMRNVWFLPAVPVLASWLTRCGFVDVQIMDVSTTSTDEQRSTEWMTFHSLSNFLQPDDPSKTIEGHPAPMRAVLTATRPS